MAVPDGHTGSTVPRRILGRRLNALRTEAGYPQRRAAQLLEWSDQKLWRIETGQTSLRGLDVEAMCRLYGADEETTAGLVGLARETKSRGWWHSYGDVIPEKFDLFIGLEEAAEELSWYESELVPGLLQTEEYADAIIASDNPGIPEDEIQRRVSVRMRRQTTLRRTQAPARLRAVLNEGVLMRPVGGQKVIAGQLRYLEDLSRLPNVALRVIPFSAGLHLGMMSKQFIILNFPETGDRRDSEPPLVYADGYTGDLYLDKPKEVERYGVAFKDIWDKAFNEQDTRGLLSNMAGKYEAE